jgi:hypothetical protein
VQRKNLVQRKQLYPNFNDHQEEFMEEECYMSYTIHMTQSMWRVSTSLSPSSCQRIRCIVKQSKTRFAYTWQCASRVYSATQIRLIAIQISLTQFTSSLWSQYQGQRQQLLVPSSIAAGINSLDTTRSYSLLLIPVI